MKLYLVQHGDSVSEEVDRERPLSAIGRADIARLAAWLAGRNVKVGAMLHSGKTRARQSAELMQSLLAHNGVLRQAEGLAPNDAPLAFLDTLRGQHEDLLVVSHLPLVGRIVSVALTGDPGRELLRFRPGSLAVLDRGAGGNWVLALFITPDSC
jgi:phosphohistidine phosphatase